MNLVEALGRACREARERAGLKQVWIAATLNVDQSTITRFEQGHWPRDLEGMLLAYEDATGIPAKNIIESGLGLWEPEPHEAFERPIRRLLDEAEKQSLSRSEEKRPAKGKPRAAGEQL